jgi:hypothetical protein
MSANKILADPIKSTDCKEGVLLNATVRANSTDHPSKVELGSISSSPFITTELFLVRFKVKEGKEKSIDRRVQGRRRQGGMIQQ